MLCPIGGHATPSVLRNEDFMRRRRSPMRRPKSRIAALLRSFWRVAAAILLAAALAGCQAWQSSTLNPKNWDLMGPGFSGTTDDIGPKLRPAGPPGEAIGLSTKARQIERSLGVQ
jgi:hypothetical protein